MAWVGGMLNLIGGRRDHYLNRQEADRARDWTKEMDNTQVQRRVADMKRAGINPMLAAVGAGGTPSAAQAAPARGGDDVGSEIMGSYFSAQQMKMMKEKNAADVAQVEANTAKTAAETKLIEAQIPHSATRAQMETDRLGGELKEQLYRIGLRRAEAYLKAGEYDQLQPLIVEYQRMLNQAEALGMKEREATAKFFDQIGEGSKWMEVIRNLLIGIRSAR